MKTAEAFKEFEKSKVSVTRYIIEGSVGTDRQGEYWLPEGLGYTQKKSEAGRFSLEEMTGHQLDGCTLWRVRD